MTWSICSRGARANFVSAICETVMLLGYGGRGLVAACPNAKHRRGLALRKLRVEVDDGRLVEQRRCFTIA
jgi:hypothetical protein